MAVLVAVSGCARTSTVQPTGGAETGAETTAAQPAAAQYADIPIPKGAKRNVDKTVVVGTETWFGQLSLDVGYDADAMFGFYTRELPNYGWRKITSVRAPISVLSYDREDRVLTIAIQANRLRGSEITLTVSPRETEPPMPRGQPGGQPGMAPGAAPPMPAPVRPRQ